MSLPDYYSDQEQKDAEQVSQAMEAIKKGKLNIAEPILLAIIANTPGDYRYEYEDAENALYIKFWDMKDFVYYATRLKEQGKAKRNIFWQLNAYGRAHYYLGFLYIRQRQSTPALKYLDAGLALEPHQPLLKMEHARAMAQSGDRLTALREFEEVIAMGDEILPSLQAVAIRGKGFELIELARLDEAEAAFRESLRVEPKSPVALHELEYIRHLRQGGELARPGLTDDPEKASPKRWWEFWRR